MRLRTYLVRRAIHTVVTLLVVLVLLFIIFRLMPGDPTRFFIAPGQPPQVRDEICVSFGLCKWVSAPGNGYEGQIQTGVPGAYNISLVVNDSAGNSAALDFVYNHVRTFREWTNSPVKIVNVSMAVNSGPFLPSAPGPEVGGNLLVEAQVLVPSAGIPTATMTLIKPVSGEVTSAGIAGSQGYFQWPVSLTEEGTYWARIDGSDGSTSRSIQLGFAAIVVPAGFQLVEERFYGFRPQFPPNTAILSVNVTSAAAPILRVVSSVRAPDGNLQTDIHMFHPLRVAQRSLAEQFVVYFINMLTGNFGRSFYTRRPVVDEISVRVGPTLLLFGSSVVISYLLGVLLGAILAWRRGTKMELASIVVSLFFYSMPVFWFGLVLLWIFAFRLDWFPLGGIGGFDPSTGAPLEGFALVGDILKHMALPLGNLVILGLAGHVLLMRNSMLEVMGEDYILTAKAKGLTERTVMYKHAARNALLPVVTALAISIGGVISGGVLTETIFSWPGMGFFLVTATLQQDYPSVQAAFFILAVITILANTVADILYAWLDPRVRL